MANLIGFLFLVLISINFASGDSSNTKCQEHFFDCGNDKCIAVFWRCDGDNDCGNWADEHFCGDQQDGVGRSILPSIASKICPKHYHHCNDSFATCIPDKWKCDGMEDCDNGSDEWNCTGSSNNCPEFTCNNMQCIPSRWRCDGLPDCEDNSDEDNCNLSKKGHLCLQERGFYECLTGDCISHKKLCDGKKDCPQGDDEGDECKSDGCHKMKCAHSCMPTSKGPECYCKDGYKLGTDGRLCEDINECQENGICSQKCMNIEGGYECDCFPGYKLVNNSRCVVEDGEPLLIFSNGEEIRGLWLRTHRYFLIHEAIKQAVGLDVYVERQKIFWVDQQAKSSAVYSANLFDSKNEVAVVTKGLDRAENLAVDWISQNIYITDSGFKSIIVCSLDGKVCSAIVNVTTGRPRGIALNPLEGVMYWSQWGQQALIRKSWMDGSHEEKLIEDNIVWPNGLSLDTTLNRLYWCDAKLNRLEYYDLKAKTRKILLQDNVFHPYSLAVFEDNLFWGDWITYSLSTCNKFSGHHQKNLIRQYGHYFMGIHVYHPISQRLTTNPCWSHRCSHLCLIVPGKQYSCACPENMTLNKDNRTCQNKPKIEVPIVSDAKLNCPFGNCSLINTCEHDKHQMKCDDGEECVPFNWVCDGEFDCKDRSDETRCHQITCKPTDFRCDNNVCIVGSFRCDREKDCTDGSDEEGCDYQKTSCPENRFKCQSDEKCLYRNEVCDGIKDCSDGEDEANCTVVSCSQHDVWCSNGSTTCIPRNWLCDGENDCGDWSDEDKAICDASVELKLSITSTPPTTTKKYRRKQFNKFSTTTIEPMIVPTDEELANDINSIEILQKTMNEKDERGNSWLTIFAGCLTVLLVFVFIAFYFKKRDYRFREFRTVRKMFNSKNSSGIKFINPIYNKGKSNVEALEEEELIENSQT